MGLGCEETNYEQLWAAFGSQISSGLTKFGFNTQIVSSSQSDSLSKNITLHLLHPSGVDPLRPTNVGILAKL